MSDQEAGIGETGNFFREPPHRVISVRFVTVLS